MLDKGTEDVVLRSYNVRSQEEGIVDEAMGACLVLEGR